MSYAVEMFFDAVSDARLRSLWDGFAAFGASSMREGDSRPHVSLGVCESVDVVDLGALLKRLAKATEPFSLTLSSVGFFPSAEAPAYLAPKVTPELLAFHAGFFEQFRPLAHGVWAHYEPEQWVPHCTLAMGIRPEQLRSGLDVCRQFGLPLTCVVSEIGIVEFRPVQQLFAVPLGRDLRNPTFRLIFLTGASGAGKSVIAETLSKQCANDSAVFFHFDSIGVPTEDEMVKRHGSGRKWQEAMTHRWVERLAGECQDKALVVLEGQVDLDFITDACKVHRVTNYTIILVHCNDRTRHRRLVERQQTELVNPQMDSWARFLKEQAERKGAAILDTSHRTIEDSVDWLRELLAGAR